MLERALGGASRAGCERALSQSFDPVGQSLVKDTPYLEMRWVDDVRSPISLVGSVR